MSKSARHRAISDQLFAQAHAELDAGDYIQASEKFWGASAHMVKAVAIQRGLRHRGHYLLGQAVKVLGERFEDDRLDMLFDSAGQLHINFYEDELKLARIQVMAQDVRQLLQRLETIYEA